MSVNSPDVNRPNPVAIVGHVTSKSDSPPAPGFVKPWPLMPTTPPRAPNASAIATENAPTPSPPIVPVAVSPDLG